MLDLRDLDCLIALARHKHFAKAAQNCGLSQPAFSMRIRNLEDRLNTRIVKRGNRFQGLTSEGEMILEHAKSIHAHVRALEEEVSANKGEIVGSLIIASIPTAAPFAARLVTRVHRKHPGIVPRIVTTNSLAIQQGIDDGQFDAGIVYSDGASTQLMNVEHLYDEEYVLLLSEEIETDATDSITWAQAAELPLILLEPRMQNRRILDLVFSEAGAHPRVIAETDGFTAAVVLAVEGKAATVLPRSMLPAMGQKDKARLLPLVEPTVQKSICLVTPRRDERIPVVDALRRTIGQDDQ